MLYYYAECHYAVCRILFTIMLNVVILSVIMLNVVMLSVVAPSSQGSWRNLQLTIINNNVRQTAFGDKHARLFQEGVRTRVQPEEPVRHLARLRHLVLRRESHCQPVAR
jgi:hypothetical protein